MQHKIPKFFSAFCIILWLAILMSLPAAQGGELLQDPLAEIEIKDDKEKNIERTGEALLDYANWLHKENPDKALGLFEKYLSENPNSPRLEEAYYGKAYCLLTQDKLIEAFKAAEKSFPEALPSIEELDKRTSLELEIGRRLLALGKKVITTGETKDEKKETGVAAASRVFSSIVYNDPQGAYVPEALVGLGDAERALGEIAGAAEIYQRVVNRHPDSPWADIAKIRAARCLAEHDTEKGIRAGKLAEAERLLLSVNRPEDDQSPLATELRQVKKLVRQKQAEGLLQKADYYMESRKERSRKAAIFVWKDILNRYADTEAALTARQKLQKAGIEVKEPEAKKDSDGTAN